MVGDISSFIVVSLLLLAQNNFYAAYLRVVTI